MMKILRVLPIVPLLIGCTVTVDRDSESVPMPEPEPGELDRSAHWLRNSAEYQAAVRQAFNIASDRVRADAAGREDGTWAVAVDADETIIDNSDYEKELALVGKESTDELWDGWVARRAAPPLPGAIDFLELVHELGGRVAVVTNRIDDHCPDTRANFLAFDIPFDVILCRTDGRRKEPRWKMIEDGSASPDLPPLEIVLWMGDNIRDFPDLDQGLRFDAAESYTAFGERFIVLPNPIYGSWTKNPKD
jgi:5'-nucleotidase (lipoprotein e(P4) family)